jgi:general secretion pathway protein C
MLQLRLPDVSNRWLPAGAAALLWALAAGSAALWGLHFPQREGVLNTPASGAPFATTEQGTAAVARALGHTSASVVAASDVERRFQLLGVIAADSGHGSALLMVEGQPAQAFVQGQTVAEGWRLQSVSRAGVRLSAVQGGAMLDLALPVKP